MYELIFAFVLVPVSARSLSFFTLFLSCSLSLSYSLPVKLFYHDIILLRLVMVMIHVLVDKVCSHMKNLDEEGAQ